MANKVTTENGCIHIWHQRLGHRGPDAIRRLVSENLVSGIQINECDKRIVCDCCVKGKMIRKSFPKVSESRAGSVLELIHTDLCGPMPTVTPNGNRYIVTFIDDFSRYTVVYFLKCKDEIMNCFKEYCASIETKFNKSVRSIRSDNGGEYIGGIMQSFLKEKGIRHQKTVPYSPQQNGVAERKNRSLTEMAKCMLLDANMENKYWAEAVNTANYIQNRLPTKPWNYGVMEWYNSMYSTFKGFW